MKKEIWEGNKLRYFDLNPIESIGSKLVWAAVGVVIGVVAMYVLT